MNSLDKQYQALLQDILDNGTKKQTRNGDTLSVFGRQIRHRMSAGFPLITTKKMYWKGIVTELIWFLRGDTNIKFLVDNDCHIWDGDCFANYQKEYKKLYYHTAQMGKEEFISRIKTDDEFAKKFGDLGKIYGHQWRSWEGREWMYDNQSGIDFLGTVCTDQIANLINDLKTNPDSRRLMVNSWNVGEISEMVLPPCHYGFQVYTRELSLRERKDYAIDILGYESLLDFGHDKNEDDIFIELMDKWGVPKRAISLMWSQRSVDTALGWPFNVASYGLLLELLGKMVNMIPDELICNLGDVHIYNNHLDGVKEQISREPYPLPKLNINTEWWPTESGECGVGPLDAQAILRGFSDDNFCKCLMEDDIQLYNYQSHPKIYFPLSN